MKSTTTTTGSVFFDDAPSITPASPFIKWPGGKAQSLPLLTKKMPEQIGTYVEPFVGGGALFFNTQPAKAILNDSNPKLINLYVSVRDHVEELVDRLSEYEARFNALNTLDEKQGFYYQTRSDFNADFKTNHTARAAAQLVFINKTCFNALYRENADGKNNAAFGWKKNVTLYDEVNLANCSTALKNVEIMNDDFEIACRNLMAGDFVYFDPPYYSTFDGYQAGGFSEEDHLRLHNLFQRLTASGVYCMLSNSNTDYIKDLYAGYNIEVVSVRHNINRNGNERQGEEVIITNYMSNQN